VFCQEIKICHVTIWDRPWLENAHQVTSFNCSASESRSSGVSLILLCITVHNSNFSAVEQNVHFMIL
jgi:hypothetical protein